MNRFETRIECSSCGSISHVKSLRLPDVFYCPVCGDEAAGAAAELPEVFNRDNWLVKELETAGLPR